MLIHFCITISHSPKHDRQMIRNIDDRENDRRPVSSMYISEFFGYIDDTGFQKNVNSIFN
jgi:hypothetical protein